MPMARLKLAPLTSFKMNSGEPGDCCLWVDGKLTLSNKPLINLTKELVTLMTDLIFFSSSHCVSKLRFVRPSSFVDF